MDEILMFEASLGIVPEQSEAVVTFLCVHKCDSF